MKVLKMFVVSDDKVCEPVHRMYLLKGHGIEGDKHAGNGSRHVSILAHSSLMTMREKGYDVKPEDFHINMLISGLNPHDVRVGDILEVEDVLLEVVQIGSLSEEQPHCDIYKQCGTCIMHTEGIFASVIKSGDVFVGNRCYQSNVATAHPTAAELRGMPCRRLTTQFYSKSKSFTYCINTVACMF